jgi:hypothetical protein
VQNFHRVDDSLASCASNPLVGDFLPPLTSFPPHKHLLSFSTGGGLTSGYVDGHSMTKSLQISLFFSNEIDFIKLSNILLRTPFEPKLDNQIAVNMFYRKKQIIKTLCIFENMF